MSTEPTGSPYEPTASPPGTPPSAGSSGPVTAVAVVNFALGVLQLLCGGCISFGGGALAGLGGQMTQGPNMDPEAAESIEQFARIGGGLILAFGVAYLLLGVMLLVAGYGVIQRRHWGRVLTLVLGAIAGILAILALVFGEWISGTINLAYAIFVFVILLNRRYAAEFA